MNSWTLPIKVLVVDTLGNLAQVLVYAANEHDSKAGCDVLKAAAQKPCLLITSYLNNKL